MNLCFFLLFRGSWLRLPVVGTFTRAFRTVCFYISGSGENMCTRYKYNRVRYFDELFAHYLITPNYGYNCMCLYRCNGNIK